MKTPEDLDKLFEVEPEEDSLFASYLDSMVSYQDEDIFDT